MPTVAVKPTRVATDWLDGDKFRDWWNLDVFMSVSPSVAGAESRVQVKNKSARRSKLRQRVVIAYN